MIPFLFQVEPYNSLQRPSRLKIHPSGGRRAVDIRRPEFELLRSPRARRLHLSLDANISYALRRIGGQIIVRAEGAAESLAHVSRAEGHRQVEDGAQEERVGIRIRCGIVSERGGCWLRFGVGRREWRIYWVLRYERRLREPAEREGGLAAVKGQIEAPQSKERLVPT